ncbi:MAG: tetratricopeptide repeat-containing diguanylate cyclase [Lachnospiraceae bacterium]|nr:tetratricopeptide repeat-containing diguanylate cyclase [Lachnospiraceae bacterium]
MTRGEDVILSEINYERTRMNQSILSILSYIANQHPLIMILNYAHYAQKSTLDLLQALIESKPIKNLGIIISYNEVIPVISYARDSWDALIKHAEKKRHIINWGTTERQQPISSTIRFSPRTTFFQSYIQILHNMVYTLAIEEANYYLDILYKKLEVEHCFAEDEFKIQLLYLYSLTAVYLEEPSKALLLLDKLKRIVNPEKDSIMYFECIYLSGNAHVQNSLYDLAIQISKECLEAAPEENHDYYVFKAHLLEYNAIFRGWSTIFLKSLHLDNVTSFCEEVEKFHYLNHLSHIYTFGYINESSFKVHEGNSFVDSTELAYLQRGVDLALQLNNLYFAVEIYKTTVLVASAFGHYQLVEEYFNKCIKLLAFLDNPVEEANIYNGLGYNSTVSGNYHKANDYYNKALSNFYQLSSIDYISETLYNKAITAILSKDYENAALYITKCIDILETMHEFKLNLCNTSKLHGLAALAYFRLDSEYNCSLYLASAKRYLSHILDSTDESKFYLWDDDLFLYYFVTGLLNKKSNEYFYAQSDFDHAKFHMMRSAGNLFFSYHMFALEQADLFTILGKKADATKILEECLEYTKTNKLDHQSYLIECALKGMEPLVEPFTLTMDKISFEMVDELANQQAAQKKLERKENHIDFLSTCQDMISHEQDKNALLHTTMIHIQNHFLLDQIILLSSNDTEDELTPFYFAEEFSLTKEQIQLITTTLSQYTSGFVVARTEKRYEEFYNLINIFDANEIACFVCIPILFNNTIRDILIGYTKLKDNFTSNSAPLTEGDLTILRFSFKQLVDSLDRIDFNQKILEYNNELQAMNNKLHESAITDVLTLLLNRQGFMKLVNPTPEAALQPQNTETKDMTILYIDLDSFKYYNDTFGHAVGDIILVGFANILKKIAKDEGYAVRYGGDEFLLVLPGTSMERAKESACAIYKELEEQNYFIDQIPHEEGETIQVPKEHFISCSIGIAATNYQEGLDISETLKHADEVLYDVKKNGKHTFRIWK